MGRRVDRVSKYRQIRFWVFAVLIYLINILLVGTVIYYAAKLLGFPLYWRGWVVGVAQLFTAFMTRIYFLPQLERRWLK